ncbi:MAG: transglutaminase-like domain-containing protein, partial [Nanoarchaeota archaeon]
DAERDYGIPFKRIRSGSLDQEVYSTLNQINESKVGIRLRNIESIALQSPTDHTSSNVIINKTWAASFLNMPDQEPFFSAALIAFKSIMNYRHNISLPIHPRLDDTTYRALSYAKSRGLDISMSDYTNANFATTVDGVDYKFILPSKFINQLPDYNESQLNIGAISADPYDPIIRMIADEVVAGSFTQEQEAAKLLKFVQSIGYNPDVGGGNFARHPLKTLLDHGGDCEDAAILYLSLLRSIGIPCMYVVAVSNNARINSHAMVAVEGDFGDKTHIPYQGRKYYIAEPASLNLEIGNTTYPVSDGNIEWHTTPLPPENTPRRKEIGRRDFLRRHIIQKIKSLV